jgi:sugar lactone lactonase YvrE
MRAWSVLAFAMTVAGCGNGSPSSASSPDSGSCTGLCTPSHLTRLDLVAGRPGGPGWVDGSLTDAHFSSLWTMVSDGSGHLFVADNMCIRVIDTKAGQVTTLAGVYDSVAGGTDGVGAKALFNLPSGLAYSGGQLYVTDTENHAIRKVDVATATVTTIGGAIGAPGAVDAVGTAARFREPEGLALDASGNLYIGDTDNNTIRKMSIATGAVTTVAGTAGQAGATDGVGAAARFKQPKALTLDGMGNAYVIDNGNLSIRKIVLATATVSTLVKFTTPPQGLTTDGANVLVTDGDQRVVSVAPDGTVTGVAGAAGQEGFVDGPPAVARFNAPAGLMNDGAGTLYVADDGNSAIRTVALSSGSVSTYAGANSVGSADGTGSQALFSSPAGIATDGVVAYVADTHNETIRRVVISTGEVTTIAGAVGQSGRTDGPAASARFDQPAGLALDVAKHLLYIADLNNFSIRILDLAHATVSTLALSAAPDGGWTGFAAPQAVAFDRGSLYVADYSNDVVSTVDLEHETVSNLAGQSGMPGSSDGKGAGAGFYGPLSVGADGRGNLFVADNQNQTIREIAIAADTVSTIAGALGVPGTTDGTGSAALFQFPTGVAVNAVGDLFVSVLPNTIRHVDTRTHVVTTVVGNQALAGVKLGPLPAQITQPTAVALMPSGALLLVSENSLLIAH